MADVPHELGLGPDSPRRATVCAVVVTHHPDAEFPKRLKTLRSEVGCVVVVDNASSTPALEMVRDVVRSTDVALIENPDNRGVAAALNQGVAVAKERGFEWVITFDQDSSVGPGLIEGYARVCDSLGQGGLASMGLLGMNHVDVNSGETYVRAPRGASRGWVERKTVITSGSLLSVRVFDDLGPFREELFIDSIDQDYCLRARARGYRVLLVLDPLVVHAMGNRKRRQLFPGVTFQTVNYPPFRWYYIVRNRLVVVVENAWREPAWAMARAGRLLVHLAGTVAFETDRLEKARCMALGALDFFTRRKPRRPHEVAPQPVQTAGRASRRQ